MECEGASVTGVAVGEWSRGLAKDVVWDGALLVLAGVVLELARRELGGLGPQGLTGERVTMDGLVRLGVTEPVGNAAAAVELAVGAIREAAMAPSQAGQFVEFLEKLAEEASIVGGVKL